MSEITLRKRIFLKASRDDVWAFLTEPEKLKQWFHAPKTPMKQGEALEMFGTTSGDLLIWGDVIAARKPEYLEYSFTVKPMGEAVSTVKWTLTEVPGGTQLDLLHENLPQGPEVFGLTLALDNGWDEHLGQMRKGLIPSE